MKRNQIDFDKTIEMKCAVCDKCYRYADFPTDRCVFGGPYPGYVQVK